MLEPLFSCDCEVVFLMAVSCASSIFGSGSLLTWLVSIVISDSLWFSGFSIGVRSFVVLEFSSAVSVWCKTLVGP